MDNRALPDQHQRRRPPVLSLFIAVVVLLAWGFFIYSQFEALGSYDWQISMPAFLGAVACGAAYFTTLACCWALLLATMSGQRCYLEAGVRAWLISMLTRYVPGNIWHIVSRIALAGRLRATRPQILASATIEQLLTLVGALGLFALSLPFWLVGNQSKFWLLVFLPLGLTLLHPRVMGVTLIWLSNRLRRPDLAWQYNYSQILHLTVLYIGANLCAGVGLLVIIVALGPIDVVAVPTIIGGSALAWAIGYLSLLTPGGLGVREGALTLILAQVVPLPVAIAGSLLFRITQTIGELLAAAIAWIYGQWLAHFHPAHDHS